MNDIVVFIPNYNGEKFLESFSLIEGLDYVVMDNASTDNSVAVCKKRHIMVIENQKMVNRVDNWNRCLQYFRNSEYKWMKWLFVGDELEPDAVKKMRDAINCYADVAALLVFDYYALYEHNKLVRFESLVGYGRIADENIIKALMTKGNLFGSPVGTLISKEAVTADVYEHNMTWAADEYLCYRLSRNRDVVFVNEIIGTFKAQERKHFKKLNKDFNSILEEMEMVRIVIQDYPEIYNKNEAEVKEYIYGLMWDIISAEKCFLFRFIAKLGRTFTKIGGKTK